VTKRALQSAAKNTMIGPLLLDFIFLRNFLIVSLQAIKETDIQKIM